MVQTVRAGVDGCAERRGTAADRGAGGGAASRAASTSVAPESNNNGRGHNQLVVSKARRGSLAPPGCCCCFCMHHNRLVAVGEHTPGASKKCVPPSLVDSAAPWYPRATIHHTGQLSLRVAVVSSAERAEGAA